MRDKPTGEGMFRAKLSCALIAGLLMFAAALPSAASAQGPGGPILVVAGNSFGTYYAEILRAEGLNEFAVGGVGDLNPQTLGAYQVVVLGEGALNDQQASALSGWVQTGGNLIAMRPDARLAPLLGLGSDTGNLGDGYIAVANSGPGAGITGETMQFHGEADRWTVADASTVATLYESATAATSSPAVTLRDVGSAGGQAAAFSYDLARSVVWTRQGNPAWAGDERDGINPVRSDDLFFGRKQTDSQPDWVNLDKVHIPQADEQQRLLANLITQMNLDRAPLPRFWYLPRGEQAAVVMTGDDHNSSRGTAAQFETFKQKSPNNCSLADWECIRSTSYVYPGAIPNGQAAAYQAEGFEIALHLNTGCADFNAGSLAEDWREDLADFRLNLPDIAPLRTNRTHCIVWSDWASEATVELEQGVRLDTNYYYWPGIFPSDHYLSPGSWMLNRPGMFTGSGIPMRFAGFDGSLIDVYQATTQLTDEWGPSGVIDEGVANHIAQLLNRALGPEGYYGVFTANMHTDSASHPGADAIVAAAKTAGVPVISAVQLLEWLDGRNGSSFEGVSFSGSQLRFGIARANGARGLEAMVPASGATGALTRDGAPVNYTVRRVKGIDYLVFDAAPGSYVATYTGGGGTLPGTGGGGFKPLPVPPISKSGALGSNQSAPRARVTKRKARASRDGIVRLRVRCLNTSTTCLTNVRLRRGGRALARRSLALEGGKTTKVKLRLWRRGRELLGEAGSLKVNAVLRVTAGERAPVVSKKRIELLAPGWR